MRNRFTLIAFLWASFLYAQQPLPVIPFSLRPEYAQAFSTQSTPVVHLPGLNTAQIAREDAQNPGEGRFAAPTTTSIDLNHYGSWTPLPAAKGRVWRCMVEAPAAEAQIIFFERFKLAEGAFLHAYTPGGELVYGAYTREHANPNGQFLIGPIRGKQAVLELFQPDGGGDSDILLDRVDLAYDASRLKNGSTVEFDFGESLPCNININCPQGSAWQTQKKGIARILMVFANGSGWCSGSLVANTSGSATPYFLSAHHCQLIGQTPDFDLWRFDFDYESPTCSNPSVEPVAKSVLGCQRIAFRQETDFMLLTLNTIPGNYGVYFNGWNRDTTSTVSNGVYIHHPIGDIKKVSVENGPIQPHPATLNWGGVFGSSPPNSHWKSVPDQGIYQGGSSGCPLFDPNKRIVGQLHGGVYNQCTVTSAYFGRFNLSWSQGPDAGSRLKEWLDPGNTGAVTKDGYFQPQPQFYAVSGNIKTYSGAPMKLMKIQISGGTSGFVYTDTLGNYIFSNIPESGNYTITPVKDTNDINGLSTFDLVLYSKHILGLDTLDAPWKILAGDANKSATLTTFDVVEMRKVLLGVNPAFPANTSWRFFPANFSFPNPANPFSSSLPPEYINIINLQSNYPNVNFRGVKIGDANNTADPGN